MKVHKRMHNVVERWIVDGRVNGKRQRPQFDSKKQVEAFMKSIEKMPLVLLRYFGPEVNKDAPSIGDHRKCKFD